MGLKFLPTSECFSSVKKLQPRIISVTWYKKKLKWILNCPSSPSKKFTAEIHNANSTTIKQNKKAVDFSSVHEIELHKNQD
jgi:hypothetical protein